MQCSWMRPRGEVGDAVDILRLLPALGLSAADVFGDVLHAITAQGAKLAFREGLGRASDDACKKIGRLLVMAGKKLQALDRESAAGDLARVAGMIKLR